MIVPFVVVSAFYGCDEPFSGILCILPDNKDLPIRKVGKFLVGIRGKIKFEREPEKMKDLH